MFESVSYCRERSKSDTFHWYYNFLYIFALAGAFQFGYIQNDFRSGLAGFIGGFVLGGTLGYTGYNNKKIRRQINFKIIAINEMRKVILIICFTGILNSCSSSGTIEGIWNGVYYSGNLKNNYDVYIDFEDVSGAKKYIEENLKNRNIFLTDNSRARFQVKLIEEDFNEDRGAGDEACYSLTFGVYDSKVNLSDTFSPTVCSDMDNLFPTKEGIKEKVYYRMVGILVKVIKRQTKKYPD